MSRFLGLLTFAVIMMSALTASATGTSSAPIGVRDPNHSEANLAVSRVSPELTSISMQSPVVVTQEQIVDYQSYQTFGIAGEPFTPQEGSPTVPQVTRFYRIPNTGGASLMITSAEYDLVDNINPFPVQPEHSGFRSLTRDDALYSTDGWYPANVAEISDPMIMRDFRVVTVTLCPVQVNPVTHQARIYRNLSVDVVANDQPGVNELLNPRQPSGEWAPIYRSMIPNLDDNALDDATTTPGTYMIVTSTNSLIRPWADSLAEWKTRKGYKVIVDARSSWSASQVSTDIHSAYQSSDPPLEFVCLMGDPGWSNVGIPIDGSNYDHTYANMTAGDNLEDIGVGRLSGGSTSTMATINAKIMQYERTPHMWTGGGAADTMWYHKSFLYAGTARNCAGNYLVMRWAKDQFLHNTGVYLDSVQTHTGDNIVNSDVTNQINAGIAFFLWRGTWEFGMPTTIADNTNPGGRLPITMTITCVAGDYSGSGINSPAEDFLCAGTASNPAGGVCGMGTSTIGTVNGANCILTTGMVYAIADAQVEHLATAVASAKAQLYSAYGPNWIDTDPYGPGGSVALNFTHYFNLLGDPGLAIWTDVPDSLTVIHPTSLNIGARTLDVTVRRAADNAFVQDALVVLWKKGPDSTWAKGLTDAQGHITLPVSVNTSGGMYITVTKRNCKPYLYTINCAQAAVMPMLSSYTLDDDNSGGTQGNGDHLMNPGETIDLPLYIRNFGSSTTATGISATLTSSNSRVTVVNATAAYANLAPGDSALGSIPFRIQVAPDLQNNIQALLTLTITSSAGQTVGVLPMTCHAGEAQYMRQHLSTVFNPGTTTNVQVVVQNRGTVAMTGVTGHLISQSIYVQATDADAVFGNIAAGALDSNTTDVFTLLSNAQTFRGHQAPMTLVLTSSTGFVDSVSFIVSVGTAASTDPTGPDAYGYYAYDNTDANYSLHPAFSYANISSGGGTNLNLSDPGEKTTPSPIYSAVRRLPFSFKFYGHVYDSITVCSNGWCAFGNQSYLDMFRNYQIPAMGAPEAMIAPYFDDLKTSGSGQGVWIMYDSVNHRYIIQWKAAAWAVTCDAGGANYTTPLDFEVILYDTTFTPTADGNGRILMQYNQVTMNLQKQYCDEAPGSTIGIQKPGNVVGLQYVYQDQYSPGAATVLNGSAILYTTDTGSTIPVPLSLISPNSGALWFQNTVNAVTWSGGLSQDHIRVELSRSGNAGPWELLTASTPNNGAFTFTASGPPSTNCFVRISSIETSSDVDTSNGAFTISAVRLLIPNGGETWGVDSTETVMWQGADPTAGIRIELSHSGTGGPWDVVNAAAPNTGSYTFTVSGSTSSNCRVRVTSVSDPSDTDMSDASFTIEAIQTVFAENFDGTVNGWSHTAPAPWHDNWNLSTEQAYSPTTSYKCGDTGTGTYSNNCDARLTSPIIPNLPANATLQFYHQIQSEVSTAHPDSAYDGGILEISVNGGSFAQVAPLGGYQETFRFWRDANGDTATGPMRGRPCWAGSITSWTPVQVDLTPYANQSIQLQWHFGSDSAGQGEGWYVDNVAISAPVVTPPAVVPTSVTCAISGNDVVLRWDADSNVAYHIYSSVNPSGPFDTLEGTSNTNSFTITNGASALRRFYIVVGWNGQ